MTDTGKTREELTAELEKLRQKVTELETSEAEHSETEKRITLLAEILENAPFSVITMDEQGNITHVNRATERLFGYSRRELIGKNPVMFNAEPDADEIQQDIMDTVRQGKVWRGEMLNRKKNGELFYCGASVYRLRDPEGNVIALVGFQRDITERKQAEEALAGSEKRFRDLAGSIADIFFAFDKNLNYTYWNRASEELTGIPAEEALGKNLYDIFPDNEQTRKAEQIYQAVIKTKRPLRFSNEYTIAGRQYIFDINAYPSEDGLSVLARDVTEQKRAEEEVQKFKKVADIATYGLSLATPEGVMTYVNDSFARMHGYTPDELIGKHFNFLYNEEQLKDIKRFRKKLWRYDSVFTEEIWHTRKDGTAFSTLTSANIVKDADGNPLFIAGSVIDITERKRMEEALRESEERYRSLVEAGEQVGEAIVMLQDTDKVKAAHIFAGPAWARITGYSLEELKNISYYDLIHPRYRDTVSDRVQRRLRGENIPGLFEISIITKDGREVPLEVAAGPTFLYKGKPTDVGYMRDITERKKAEAALRESEERLALLYDEAPVGYHELDSQGRIVQVNRTELEMLGYTAEEMLGKYVWDFMVEKKTSRKAFAAKIAGTMPPGQSFERTYRRKDGTLMPALIEDRYVKDEHGKVIGLRSTMQDITERKCAEEALKESEERYRALVNLGAEVGEAVVMLQDDERGVGMHVFASDAWSRITGYSVAELLNISMADLIHPRDRADAVARHNRRMREEELPGLYEITIIRKDGTEVPVEVTYAFSHYKGKRVNVGYIRDITRRRQAEEALQLRANLLNNATDSIMAADLEGNIIYANDTACRTHGYTKEKMLEMNLRDTVPRQQADLASGRIEKLIEGGHLLFESEHRRRDGSTFPAEITARTINLGERTVILSVQRDITERKKAEAEYQTIVRTAMDGFWLLDMRGRFLEVNDAYCHMIGYSRDELLHMAIPDIEVVEKPLEVAERIQKIKEVGQDRFETRHRRKDGDIVDVEISVNYIPTKEGQMFVFIRDITQRKQAEEEIIKFKTIADVAQYGVGIADLDGTMTYANEALASMHGYAPDEITGQHFSILYTEEQLVAVEKLRKRCREKGSFTGEEVWRRRKDDTIFPSSMSMNSVRDDEGKPLYFSAIVIDITERKQAEEALRESEERYRTLVELGSRAGDAVVLLQDTEKGTAMPTYFNDKWPGITGYSRDELYNMSWFDLLHRKYHKDTWKRYHRRMRGEHIPQLIEASIINKSGQEIPVELTAAYTLYLGKDAVVVYIRDITERKKMEEEHQRATKLESLGTLAGGIAHDFNNLLTGILGNVSLAKRYVEPDSKASVRLDEAEKAAIRSRDLTQQLLTFSRGGAPIKKTVSIDKLLADATRFALRGTSIRPEFFFARRIWPVDIDEGQITQVLTNLIINACEAMPQGGTVQVGARNLSAREVRSLKLTPGQYIEVTVSDQGAGIPPEHIGQIFEPYFTTKAKGSGLGLATVYSIIKNHDGHITVESEVGKGTTFHIYLPASKKPVATTAEKPADVPVSGEGKLLVMDDEDTIREFLYHELTDAGYDVTITSDGAEAIREYEKAKNEGRPFQAVILDLTVSGGVGGKEAIKQLREIDPGVKAIASSGYATDPIMAKHRKYGFRAVVAKPYRVDELEKTLQDVLRTKR